MIGISFCGKCLIVCASRQAAVQKGVVDQRRTRGTVPAHARRCGSSAASTARDESPPQSLVRRPSLSGPTPVQKLSTIPPSHRLKKHGIFNPGLSILVRKQERNIDRVLGMSLHKLRRGPVDQGRGKVLSTAALTPPLDATPTSDVHKQGGETEINHLDLSYLTSRIRCVPFSIALRASSGLIVDGRCLPECVMIATLAVRRKLATPCNEWLTMRM